MNTATWQKYNLYQQLGNIGSEISRALSWEKSRNNENRQKALERTLDLLDLTINDIRWKKKRKELLRLREVTSDQITNNIYNINLENLLNYCIDFAVLARGK